MRKNMANRIQVGFSTVFADKLSFTSDDYYSENPISLWVGCTGVGPVYIETLGSDNVWRTYPELTFTKTTAQTVNLRRGFFRFRFDAPTATTVEVAV